MKTKNFAFGKKLNKTILVGVLSLFNAFSIQAQTSPELVFRNPVLESGTAGADNAVYRFSNVTNNVDALVKISGRSSSLVKLVSIDVSNLGYGNSFQPEITYNNGNAQANRNWWMDFDIDFVNRAGSTPVNVSAFKITALDVDGDGSRLNEYVSFYNAHSYLLESNTLLSVQSILDLVLNLLTPGRQFKGPVRNFTNIDVNATEVMTTVAYNDKNTFRLRAGAETGNGSTTAASRMYSFWFKSFDYQNAVEVTLPVEFHSFTALLDKSDEKVNLRWITASEMNVSHFAVEKSNDGKNFTDIGVVFAKGNSEEEIQYNFVNNLSGRQSGVIYYRIRSVDIDGKTQYSVIRVINLTQSVSAAISITTYPNPATSELRVTIPANWQNKRIVYEVVNQAGQVVAKKDISNSSQTENLNISHLSPGIYFIRAIGNGETAQQKIIKQ